MRIVAFRVAVFILTLAWLAASVKPGLAAPTQLCPEQYLRKESPTLSGEQINQDAVGEYSSIRKYLACLPLEPSGGKLRFRCFGVSVPIIYTNKEGGLTLSDPSNMPMELIRARKLALSGDPESTEPGILTGSIPKTLMPGYKQKDERGIEIDPRVALTKAEGQLAQGWVVGNQLAKQINVRSTTGELEADRSNDPGEDSPYWDIRVEGKEGELEAGEENYQLEGKFGEVAPLYDRYGILAQAFSFPTDEYLELPYANCPADTFNPRPIVPTGDESWFRKAIWSAIENFRTVTRIEECDIGLGTAECLARLILPQAEEGARGNLELQSKVSLAGGAWANMAGPKGAFATLLPPETIFKSEDNEEPSVKFEHTGGINVPGLGRFQNTASSVLKIASLGNVGEAVDCLIYGLTAHPANARAQVCDDVVISGKFIGWPTYRGFIFQGPKASCPHCTHRLVEAIDVGPGPNVNIGDAVLATVKGVIVGVGTDSIYGNYIDLQSTDPSVPTTIRYGHLSAIHVRGGQTVSPGEVIGAIGDTGMGGVHLHYEFRLSTLEMKVPYIPDDGGGAIRGCHFPYCPDIRW